jgi:uncharacterized Zn finger protein
MTEKNSKDQIVKDQLDLRFDQVEELDREVSEGQGLAYYESVQISRANVYRNTLSGRVGDLAEYYDVRITVHRQQISGTCSCGESREICRHILALLYSWVQDGKDFIDIGEKIAQLQHFDHDRLIEVISNILRFNPGLLDLFFEKDRSDWDEWYAEQDNDLN